MQIYEKIVCLKCIYSRFPDPKEQCYKWGGLICSIDKSNVGKYDECRFPDGTAKEIDNKEY